MGPVQLQFGCDFHSFIYFLQEQRWMDEWMDGIFPSPQPECSNLITRQLKESIKNSFKLLTWMCRASQDAVAFQHCEMLFLCPLAAFRMIYQPRCNYIVTTTYIDTPLVNFSSLSAHLVAFWSFYPHKNFLSYFKKKKKKDIFRDSSRGPFLIICF